MEKIKILPIERKRVWLPIRHGRKTIRFAYPPVEGNHRECFETLNADPEVRPAEGIELALLTHSTYTGKDEWEEVRKSCFQSNYTRTPNRILWIPRGFIGCDKSLSGVLVEKDLNGRSLFTKTDVQTMELADWKEQDGLYKQGNLTFVPSDKYSVGKMKEDDRFVRAILGDEGISIFIKTAKDSKLVPYNWGCNVNEFEKPEQRIVALIGCYDALGLDGYWGDNSHIRAFGVSKSGEASA